MPYWCSCEHDKSIFTHEQIIDRVNETDAEIMFVLDQLFDRIQPILPKLCIKKIVIISAFDEMPAVTKMVASVKTKKHIPYSDKIVRWRTFISEGRTLIKQLTLCMKMICRLLW